jgi:hypothetical protein
MNMLANCSVDMVGRQRYQHDAVDKGGGRWRGTKLGPQGDADAMEGKPTSVVIVRTIQELLGVV